VSWWPATQPLLSEQCPGGQQLNLFREVIILLTHNTIYLSELAPGEKQLNLFIQDSALFTKNNAWW
jgi:hypothetical protein